jgi:hypothetical protein
MYVTNETGEPDTSAVFLAFLGAAAGLQGRMAGEEP